MNWLKDLLRKEHREGRLEREVRFHLDRMEEQYRAAGMSAAEARRRARLEFGGVEGIKEEMREARKAHYLEQLGQDLRYALRGMRRNGAFAAVFAGIVALGIGANAVVFSVVHAVLLRSLPYTDAHRVVRLFQFKQTQGRHTVSPPNYLDWAGRNQSMEGMAAYQFQVFEGNEEDGDPVRGAKASRDLFAVLGVEPALGRVFSAEEDSPAGGLVAILSDELWRGRFQANPAAIGQTIRLGGGTHTIVGVMPPGFWFPIRQAAIWTPLRLGDRTHRMRRTENYLSVVARLKPGIRMEDARADLGRVARQLAAEYPLEDGGLQVDVAPIRDVILGDAQRPLAISQASVLLVLLIACGNLVLLQLARASNRIKEFAVRAALGAGAGRLIRQVLVESVLLASAGAAAGAGLAWLALAAFRSWIPSTLPRYQDVALNWPVLAFAAAHAILVIALVGWVPAAISWRTDLLAPLHTIRVGPGSQRSGLRNALIVAQVALSCVLLLGSALLIRSLRKVLTQDIGFRSQQVLTVNVAAPQGDPERWAAHFAELQEQVSSLPGVTQVGFANYSPLIPEGVGTRFTIASRPPPIPDEIPAASYRVVSRGYFQAMGARLLAGRDFTAAGGAGRAPEFIINQAMARRYWPDGDPLGDRIRRGGLDSNSTYGTIVGVVADMKQQSLESSVAPEIFIPFETFSWPSVYLVLRSELETGALAASLRAAILKHHPSNRIGEMRTLEQLMTQNVRARSFNTGLLSALTGLALLLAAAGIYGVVSYGVNLRTREFGIRLALGSSRIGVATLAVSQTIRLLAGGVAVGLVAAWGLARLIESQLFGIAATDARSYLAAAVFMLLATALAAYLPAKRAASIDPAASIRTE